jgi:5,10-methylenetetrahydromethanopterin reductase
VAVPDRKTEAAGNSATPRKRRKIGIGFGGGPYMVQQMTEAVRLAEQRGFDSAWMTNDMGGRTPFVTLACWAMSTERMRLGVAVSNPVTRHPVELAQTVATLDEACNGRAILGIGTGNSFRLVICDQLAKPIGFMQEAIQIIREIWALPQTTYRGIPVSIRESEWIWPNGSLATFRENIDLYLAAWGPQMTRLAARRADGLLIGMAKYAPEIAAQVALFRATAKDAGRDPDELEIGQLIMTYTAESDHDLEAIRRVVAFQTQRLTDEAARQRGFELEAFQKIKDIYARHAEKGGILKHGMEPAAYEAAPHVTQTMLEAFAVFGPPDQCVRQLEKYLAAGVKLPILVPLGCDVRLVIEVGQAFLAAE